MHHSDQFAFHKFFLASDNDKCTFTTGLPKINQMVLQDKSASVTCMSDVEIPYEMSAFFFFLPFHTFIKAFSGAISSCQSVPLLLDI